MSSLPILLVTGATGAQGGSVVKAALASGKFAVRALTRDPSKPAAQALAAQGVEVVKGDLSDVASVQAALAGAESAFLVTQFWEKFNKGLELQEAKNFIDAAKASGLKRLVFSALEDVEKETAGRITKVAHFDGKGQALAYLQASGLPFVALGLSFYSENFLSFFPPRKNEDGTYGITMPMADKPLNAVSVADTGKYVVAALNAFEAYKGKFIPLVSDLKPVAWFAEVLSRATGKEVKYNAVPVEVFASFGFPGAEDLAWMFAWYMEPNCDRNPAHAAALLEAGAFSASSVTGFEQWANENKDKLLAAMQ